MRTSFTVRASYTLQAKLYDHLNEFSQSHKILGRFSALPIALLDVACDNLEIPVNAIEQIAMAALNLVGTVFSLKSALAGKPANYNLKDALRCAEWGMGSVVCIPVKLALAPAKIIYQFFAILICPEKVQSCSSFNTFKSQ
ncbi:hypothetical protein [Parachlamydia sp. AcF125]|uniref:hypothetical protein n=1 Tax=Parachlamydia sp. AcF125 TaxID=2795736 RepID=UPI001BCA17F3|nr:hypothetical protein [Parachlamydia sp. AcF125]MBS4168180.1 hypothetical protein [Parachlamydia sp. AcF125]